MALPELIVGLTSAAAGFVIKSIYTFVSERHSKLLDMQLTTLAAEQKEVLQKFYWPIYIRLCDSYTTKSMIISQKQMGHTETVRMLQGSMFQIHDEIIGIIKENTSVAHPTPFMLELILQYISHIRTFRGFHDGTVMGNYIHFPDVFMTEIESVVNRMQSEYNAILGIHNMDFSAKKAFINNFKPIESRQDSATVQRSLSQTPPDETTPAATVWRRVSKLVLRTTSLNAGPTTPIDLERQQQLSPRPFSDIISSSSH